MQRIKEYIQFLIMLAFNAGLAYGLYMLYQLLLPYVLPYIEAYELKI